MFYMSFLVKNAVQTHTRLSTITSLQALLCTCMSVIETFTVHLLHRTVQITSELYQTTTPQKKGIY